MPMQDSLDSLIQSMVLTILSLQNNTTEVGLLYKILLSA